MVSTGKTVRHCFPFWGFFINDENLIKMISDNEKAKQFWEKFLGKDILDELLKYPELLSMQDAKRAKVTKEEKEFFGFPSDV